MSEGESGVVGRLRRSRRLSRLFFSSSDESGRDSTILPPIEGFRLPVPGTARTAMSEQPRQSNANPKHAIVGYLSPHEQ